MANITILQPSDYLKDSRAIINTNFANLNAAVSALSGNANLNTFNFSVSSGGTIGGVPNDAITIKGTSIALKTVNPLQNGNITLSANNGYVQVYTTGGGTQLIDDLQDTNVGGNWLELYRINSLSGNKDGTAYIVSDRAMWPKLGQSNEGLLVYGTRKDSSIALTSFTGYNNTIPGIYIPSVSSAQLYNSKVELIGPNGSLTKILTVGNQPLYGAPDNITTTASANNLIVYPDSLSNLGATGQSMILSAFDALKTVASQHIIATSNPQLNGNITLSANNGFIQLYTVGGGTQLIDDLNQASVGGNWLEFYRVNSASANKDGTAYIISDRAMWPKLGEPNEGLLVYGTRKDSSIAITSFTGYNNTIPGVYIPSVSSSQLYDAKVELVGPEGALTRVLTVGNSPFYGAPDNITTLASANNLIVYAEPSPGIGVTEQTMVLSAFDAFRTVASHYIIATSNPGHNGNITLSGNNGFIQHHTVGGGTQLIDDCQGAAAGGNWVEFYRVNALSGVPVGTRYIIGDRPWWPKILDNNNEGLTFYGTSSGTSIAITSGPGYNDQVPGLYIPSLHQTVSGVNIELLGDNGILVRKTTIGNKPSYGFGVVPVSSVNISTFLDETTRTIITSAHENTTSITLQAGNQGKINLKSGGNAVGLERERYLELEGRTINVITPSGGPSQFQINSYAPGYAGVNFIQDPTETYGYNLKPYATFQPLFTAGSGAYYARGTVFNAIDSHLILSTTSTSAAFSATDIKLQAINDRSIYFNLLSSTNSLTPSAISLRMYRDIDTFILDVNPDNFPDAEGINYADFRIINSSKSYGVQIPNLQVDHIHNYNTGNITISARDTGNIIIVPATSAENLWIQEGGIKFPDGTRQTTASLQGTQGTQGIQGPSDGAQGTTGSQGATGAQGLNGIQGAIGTGVQGTTGAQGLDGVQGLDGAQGAVGTGTQGTTGAQGLDGTQGVQGPSDGAQGTTGTQGATGAQGLDGAQGVTGTAGTQGIAGTQGTDGTAGTQGTDGSQGATGAGTQGTTGAQGLDGVQGTDGAQGATGAGTQGTTGAQGLDGVQGTDGAQGATGAGTQGTTGAQGLDGVQGAIGAQGTDGTTGAQGVAGAQGIDGAQGTDGTTGAQGVAGAQGIDGAQGTTGTAGTQGTTGTSGYSGTFASNTDINIGTGSLTATNGYFTGKLKLEQAQESFAVYNTAIGASTVNLDCSANNIWFIQSSVSQNWTVNLQNTNIDSLYASNIVLLINQGSPAYIPNTLQLDGVGQSINWQGGGAPSGNANKKDSVSFTILNNSGTYTVLGQLVTFG